MLEISLSLGIIILYFIGTYMVKEALEALGRRKEAAPKRAVYISKVFNFGLAIMGVFILCLVWGVDYSSLLVAASSTLAVIGVAFFAQWSILSNITASIVIFFTYPTRIGDRVKILDTETTTVEGRIIDINLFQVLVETENRGIINYPNNLFIQKPVLRLNKESAVADPTDEILES
jgi:small-conductance mechanosensitive channel